MCVDLMNQIGPLEVLARGEDSHHQFKRDVTNADSLAAELAAFANSGGGRLFLGVNDDGSIAGLEAAAVRRPSSPAPRMCRPIQPPHQSPHQSPHQWGLSKLLLNAWKIGGSYIRERLQLKDHTHEREHYSEPALGHGLVEYTIRDKPNSRLQRYRLTAMTKSCVSLLDYWPISGITILD